MISVGPRVPRGVRGAFRFLGRCAFRPDCRPPSVRDRGFQEAPALPLPSSSSSCPPGRGRGMGGSASEVPGLPRTKRRTPPRAPTEPEPAHPPLRSRGLEGWAPQTASTREGGGAAPAPRGIPLGKSTMDKRLVGGGKAHPLKSPADMRLQVSPPPPAHVGSGLFLESFLSNWRPGVEGKAPGLRDHPPATHVVVPISLPAGHLIVSLTPSTGATSDTRESK